MVAMSTTREVYLTATGAFLPGDPLGHDEIARRPGSATSVGDQRHGRPGVRDDDARPDQVWTVS
jgi:hypothetical protein